MESQFLDLDIRLVVVDDLLMKTVTEIIFWEHGQHIICNVPPRDDVDYVLQAVVVLELRYPIGDVTGMDECLYVLGLLLDVDYGQLLGWVFLDRSLESVLEVLVIPSLQTLDLERADLLLDLPVELANNIDSRCLPLRLDTHNV